MFMLHTASARHRPAPVVLLHASGSSHRQFRSAIDAMSDRYALFAFDLPGYPGAVERGAGRDDENDLSQVAEPLLAQIIQLGEPVHLVGHSFGGAVALKLATMRPDLVKSLTLFEPAAFHLLRSGSANERKAWEAFERLGTRVDDSLAQGDAELGLRQFVEFWNGPEAWSAMPESARQRLSALMPVVADDFARIFAEQADADSLAALDMPTLVMSGLDSPALGQVVAAKVAASLGNARHAMLPGLGHMAPVTDPDWVLPRIADHIGRAERATSKPEIPWQRAA